MSLRSPLARARGLGAAHNGTHHWWSQRLTAIALLPLLLWFAVSMTSLATAGYAAVTMWLRAPVNAILMLALIAALFHHMQLGLQVVVEDYVHGHARKFLLLLIIKYGAALLAISTAFAVLKVAFA
jgi:succinate dehydrogenase / fumarate reductase membrane anchor subunit